MTKRKEGKREERGKDYTLDFMMEKRKERGKKEMKKTFFIGTEQS